MVKKQKDYQLNFTINMFWKRRKSPIEKDIAEFGEMRKMYITTHAHVEHIRTFMKVTGINKYEDITEQDIDGYLSAIHSSVHRESERIEIAQALFLFLRFKKLQLLNNQPKRGRGRPEKKERNYAIMALRQLKYTYAEIAKEKTLSKNTIYKIVQRLENNRFD